MEEGLKFLRERAKMTHDDAAAAMGISRGGFIKLERGERKLSAVHIRRACVVFKATPSEVLGAESIVPDPSDQWPIDTEKLARLITEARERLGDLPEDEARNLVAALISASRTRPGHK